MTDDQELRQQPARLVRSMDEIGMTEIDDATNVELVQVLISRADQLRTRAEEVAVARDLSIAITHLEDARTRLNAAAYRLKGTFSISDAER